MVETRKRKSTRVSPKSKKAKAAEEKPVVEEQLTSPTKDEHTAAAEALKALKGGDIDNTVAAAADVNVAVEAVVAEEDEESGDKTNDPVAEEDAGGVGDNPTEETSSSEAKGEAKDEEAEAADETGDKPTETADVNVVADTKAKPTEESPPSEVTSDVTSEPKVEAAAAKPADKAPAPATSHAPSQPQPQPSVPADSNSGNNANDAFVEDSAQVPPLYVGRIIGKGGEMIRDLEARSGAKIDVNQSVTPKVITYRGTRAEIDFAKQLVSMLCTEKGDTTKLPVGRAALKVVAVPGSVIGKIIGRKGEMIRKLQNESRAKIEVDHSGAGMGGVDNRQVTITGTNDAVVKAEEMVKFLGANPAVDGMEALSMLIRDKSQGGKSWGSGPPYPNFPNQGCGMPAECGQNNAGMNYNQGGYGGHPPPVANQYNNGPPNQHAPQYGGGGGMGGVESELWPCSKIHMGRVIGQRGITVNDLQKRSGCDIQINQNVSAGQDCQVTIKGARQGIEMVKQMLQEIIDLGHNHPYAGGHGAPAGGGGGGYGQQPGWGQQPQGQQGYHQQQAPHQANAYGANPGYQNQGYPQQQQQQYGNPPNQYYGAQPMHQMPQPYPQQGQQYAAPNMPPAQASSPWRAAQAADGQTYYFNEVTRQTQWERPAGMQ